MNTVKSNIFLEVDGSIVIYNGQLHELGITLEDIPAEAEVYELVDWDLPIDATLEDLTNSFKISHPELFI